MTGPCPTFEPETIRAMHMAFEEACDSLQLTHRRAQSKVPVVDMIAKLAKTGERDSRQVARRVIAGLARRLYPDMQVDLVTEDRPIDIVAEGFDAGVRPGDTVPADRIAVHLEPAQRFAVVGSPAYFEGRTPPETPQDLLHHTCIRARMPSGSMYRWEFEQDGRAITLDVPGQLTLDDASLTLEAALFGTGLAYLAEWWIGESVREGKLRRVLDGFTPTSAGLCLYYPSRRYQPAGLRALIAFRRRVARQYEG
jgi:DNA-binding transcriptional LysR family regulator